MELRHLRYFRAVAESQGFREAARRLHVVQPALSQTVSDLERELGVRLLTRNSRSVRLTSEGEVFLKEAKDILAHADRSVELARGASRGEIGSLSVGFLGSATAFFLPRIIREFRRRFPGVRLTLREMAPTHQIDEFRAGRLDVGFTRPIPAPDDAWLRSECLYRDSLLAVLPKGHPASTRPVVPVKQLAAEPFVLFHRAGAPGSSVCEQSAGQRCRLATRRTRHRSHSFDDGLARRPREPRAPIVPGSRSRAGGNNQRHASRAASSLIRTPTFRGPKPVRRSGRHL